jgi:hypothetical protein
VLLERRLPQRVEEHPSGTRDERPGGDRNSRCPDREQRGVRSRTANASAIGAMPSPSSEIVCPKKSSRNSRS